MFDSIQPFTRHAALTAVVVFASFGCERAQTLHELTVTPVDASGGVAISSDGLMQVVVPEGAARLEVEIETIRETLSPTYRVGPSDLELPSGAKVWIDPGTRTDVVIARSMTEVPVPLETTPASEPFLEASFAGPETYGLVAAGAAPLSWTARASMPTARAFFAAAALDGQIYVAGGEDGTTVFDTLEIYDVASDSWSTGAPMPVAWHRVQAAAANDAVYVFGGAEELDIGTFSESSLEMLAYDPVTGSWSGPTPIPFPTGSWYHLDAIAHADQILVVGYQLDSLRPHAAALFDPSTAQWTSVDAPDGHGFKFLGDTLDGAVYGIATGTWGMDPQRPFRRIADPSAGVWETLAPVPSPGNLDHPNDDMGFAAAFGGLVVAGGYQQGAPTLVYDPASDQWTPQAGLTVSRAQPELVQVNGRLFAIGGIAASPDPSMNYGPWSVRLDAVEELSP